MALIFLEFGESLSQKKIGKDHQGNSPENEHGTWKWWVFNRNLLFQGFIFRFHVSFTGCNSLLKVGWVIPNIYKEFRLRPWHIYLQVQSSPSFQKNVTSFDAIKTMGFFFRVCYGRYGSFLLSLARPILKVYGMEDPIGERSPKRRSKFSALQKVESFHRHSIWFEKKHPFSIPPKVFSLELFLVGKSLDLFFFGDFLLCTTVKSPCSPPFWENIFHFFCIRIEESQIQESWWTNDMSLEPDVRSSQQPTNQPTNANHMALKKPRLLCVGR